MIRKSILLLAAAAALASCTQSEVLEVAENRAISFDPFVGKATRAATEIVDPNTGSGTKLTTFWVFGRYGESSSATTYDEVVYTNAEVDVTSSHTNVSPTGNTQYWVPGKKYMFAAYSNGNNQIQTTKSDATVSFGNDGHIKIENYQAGTNDLILAIPNAVTTTGDLSASNPGAVQLTFKHLLSQVSFEFENDFTTTGYTLDITNLSFSVKNQGNYASTGWTVTDTPTKINTQASVATDVVTSNSVSSESWFVIPQSNTSYTASFTATIKDNNQVVVKTNTFNDIPLKTGETTTPGGDSNEWKSGYRYKYTAEINPTNMGLNEIKFTVSVDEWENADPEINVTPTNP